MILSVDTETSGLPKKYLSVDHPEQPYLVELGAILADEENDKEIASISLLVKPDGWVIPDEAARVHGITTERATAAGVPALVALSALTHLWAQADALIAYNLPFDLRILNIAMARLGRASLLPRPARSVCVMEMATPVVNLPPTERMLAAGFNRPKSPTLMEAHEALFGERFDGAHGALVDARQALKLYRKLL